MPADPRIYVAGARTLIGSAILRRLIEQRVPNIVNENEPDLTDRLAVERFVDRVRPDWIFVAAGKFGDVRASFQAGLFASDITLYSARVLNGENGMCGAVRAP